MPTLQKTLGIREYTTEALNTLSFRLLSAGLSFQKEGDIVYQLLDQVIDCDVVYTILMSSGTAPLGVFLLYLGTNTGLAAGPLTPLCSYY